MSSTPLHPERVLRFLDPLSAGISSFGGGECAELIDTKRPSVRLILLQQRKATLKSSGKSRAYIDPQNNVMT